ncbi:hypothetical protein COOONC_11462 [Cooperia oncophora]
MQGAKWVNYSFILLKRTNRRGFDLDTLCKQFERKAVLDLSICEEQDLVFCVSDGQMAAHYLKDRHFPVVSILHKIKPVTGFATWIPEDGDDMHIFVSSKKRLYLFKWFEKDFQDVRFECNQSFADKPNTMRIIGNTLVMSCGREYLLVKLTKTTSEDGESWTGDCRRLFDVSDNPSIIVMRDRDLLGFSHGDTLILTNLEGQKTPLADVRFSDVPCDIYYNHFNTQFLYDAPYVVGLLPKGRVEVRSLNPPHLIQSMALSKASLLCVGNPVLQHLTSTFSGYVFISSPFDVWMLDAHVNIRKNVSTLISDKQFELAIQVVTSSTALSRMFPGVFWPENWRFARFIKPTPEFSQHVRIDPKPSTVNPEASQKPSRISLQVVDTALLKCYLQASLKLVYCDRSTADITQTRTLLFQTRPSLVDSLLRLHNNSCFFEDAESILLNENRLPSLFILYESRKKHEMALELLHKQFLDPDADPFFHDLDRTVGYLQTLGNTHLELIFKYARWVLDKDMASGLEIFIGEESDVARNLDRQAVLAFLRSHCVAAVIPYLEHIIYKWDETRPKFHDTLVEHYIINLKLLQQDYEHAFPDEENISRAGDEGGELGEMRRRLIKFLRFSLYFSPQAVLLQLSNSGKLQF